ncbi:MAG: hypothetical protein N2317_07060 [Syntrophales bacterium]|nr:hypothetical protein [Syntrophales bacterium]
MKIRLISALFLFLFSTALPLVAYKAEPPKYLTTRELQIANYQEPFDVQVAERKVYHISTLDNPFRFKSVILAKTEGETAQRTPFIPSLSLIYSGIERYALIGEEILEEGKRAGEFEVIKILEDRVLIKDKRGQKRWLKLEYF